MFGFSFPTRLFQRSRTWNCVTHLTSLIWGKFGHLRQSQINMPRTRKRHHSRSRSKSRSLSPDKIHDKHKKTDSHEKDGKRRRLDDVDSPNIKRSLSTDSLDPVLDRQQEVCKAKGDKEVSKDVVVEIDDSDDVELEKMPDSDSEDDETGVNDSDSPKVSAKEELHQKLTPKKPLTPKQLQKKLESEKKKQQKQKEREEKERQRQEEKAKALAEKQLLKQQKEAEKQKLLEQKQKEKEMKEEQRKKEKEEKEQKRKEKEEMEAQKKRERELEKLKKQQEKEKEKEKEEEKKKKSAALFVNFFKKADGGEERERKVEKVNSNFMPFEVKSDMRLPPLRRRSFSEKAQNLVDSFIENPDEAASYLKDLKAGYAPMKSGRTWPYEDPDDDDEVTIVEEEEDKLLGETISEDTAKMPKLKAKLLQFHENRRPAYFGTWRKITKSVGPRRPFREDKEVFNYEEDSDDDWEEEEQGESLDESAAEEEEKEAGNDEDDYEVDNDFFVPHGHLSDDEVDDEETARLSPESMKQKLKLLKDEFDEDMNTKTRKLKPRSIGCIWYSKKGNNVEEAIHRYLQPFAALINGRIEIKKRSEIFVPASEKKKLKHAPELPSEHVPHFLRIIQGSERNQKVLVEEFLTYMANNGFQVEVSKASLTRFLKQSATYRKCPEGPTKNKFGWFLNEDVKEKYGFKIESE